MSQHYTVTAEVRGEVGIFTLREAGGASAAIAPAWGNTCFALQVHEPVLEPVPFEELRQRPTSYGIPILFPFPNRLRDGAFAGFRFGRSAVLILHVAMQKSAVPRLLRYGEDRVRT